MKKYFLIFCLLLSQFTFAQNITTIAGNGSNLNTGDGFPAISAGIYIPGNAVFDKYGNYYLSTGIGNKVRKISVAGIITTVVGTGLGGFSGDSGLATIAKLHNVQFVVLDTLGNLFLSDELNNRIRKVDITTGIITTIAGNGSAGFAGDGLPATGALLNNPNGLCFDKKGNLYIADYGNSRIRKISPTGIISTFAGTGINGYNGDGGLADTSKLKGVLELCSDDTGNIYLADEENGRVRKVDTFGIIHTIAGTGTPGFSGDGMSATLAHVQPHFITYDKFGNIYFSDVYSIRVRKINSSGIITTVAGNGISGYFGDGGPAITAEMTTPFGVTTDTCGNLYICDGNNYRLRKVIFDTSCHAYNGTLIVQDVTPISISVFPNPASTVLTIEAQNKVKQVIINNLLGQTIYCRAYDVEKAKVSISNFPAGLYIVKVTDDEGKTTITKFIKQ